MGADVSRLDRTLADRMGIRILEFAADRVVGTMPVQGNAAAGGTMHTGASCVLAETLAWSGATAHGGPGRSATTIEISATHHRIATDGVVTGIATRVHGGRTLARYDVEITDGRGRRVCTARLTCRLRDGCRPDGGPGSGEPGGPGSDGPGSGRRGTVGDAGNGQAARGGP